MQRYEYDFERARNDFLEKCMVFLESQMNLDPSIFFLTITFSWITNCLALINVWIKVEHIKSAVFERPIAQKSDISIFVVGCRFADVALLLALLSFPFSSISEQSKDNPEGMYSFKFKIGKSRGEKDWKTSRCNGIGRNTRSLRKRTTTLFARKRCRSHHSSHPRHRNTCFYGV